MKEFTYIDSKKNPIIKIILMEGANSKGSYSRFRRQPKNDSLRPLYMHGAGLNISRDYSEPNFFIASAKHWNDTLVEVPFLINIKQMELVRRSGEIVAFSNRNCKHMNQLNLKADTDPIIELRIY